MWIAKLQRSRPALAAVTALASGCLTLGMVLVTGLPAWSDSAAASQLDFVGFVHDSDLTLPDGSTPSHMDTILAAGVDSGLGDLILYDHKYRAVIRVNTTSLTQDGPAIAIGPPTGDQHPGAVLVSTATHTFYVGRAESSNGNCSAYQPICSTVPGAPVASPLAMPASIAATDLQTGVTHTVILPDSTDGADVVGLRDATGPDGRHYLYALLYMDHGPPLEPATLHGLTLVALDADKIEAGSTDGAVLWSYAIPQCMSTPKWQVQRVGDFLGLDPGGRYAYFACRGLDDGSSLDVEQPAGAVIIDFPSAFYAAQSTSGFTTTSYPFGAPTTFAISGGNQDLGVLFLASTGSPDKAYVFDPTHRAWVGSVPFAPGVQGQDLADIVADPSNGRAYAIYPNPATASFPATSVPTEQGGSVSYGDFSPLGGTSTAIDPVHHFLMISQGLNGTAGTFAHADYNPGSNPNATYPVDDQIAVFQDNRTLPATDQPADPDSLTHDIDVTDSTPVTHGAFASAFGSKVSVVGGVHSTSGYAIQVGGAPGAAGAAAAACNATNQQGNPEPVCLDIPSMNDDTRTVTLGQVSDVEASNSAATSNAAPVVVDTTSNSDIDAVQSYQPTDLLAPMSPDGFSPPSVPPLPGQVTDAQDQAEAPVHDQQAPAQCSDYGDKPTSTTTPGAASSCDASTSDAQGAAATPNVVADSPAQVAYSGSSVHVSRGEGTPVSAAVADARGITIALPGGPTVSIGEIKTIATASAGGRPGTAASGFRREISDFLLRGPDGSVLYSCGFAGAKAGDGSGDQCDARQMTDAINGLTEFPVYFQTPSPDSQPVVTGSPAGAQAEIIKSKYQFWNDYFTNNDNGLEVPGLQVVVVGDYHQPSRLVMQFAGVHVEAHDAIGLAPPPPPALPDPTLKISLTDGSTPAVPLAGGAFSLVADDGSTAGTCSTEADGIGSCSFPDVKPGNYTIKESAAPPGYAPAPDYQLSLDPGQDYTATFVNLLAIGAVHVSLTSAVDKSPLSGATFAMYAGSSILGTPLATCTTDKDGTCGFTKVPLASYTMHQQSTPKGFLPSKDVAFDLTDPGQDATLDFVDGTPAVQGVKGKFIPGKPAVPPHTEVVGGGGGMSIPLLPTASSTGSGLAPVLSSAPSAQSPIVAGLPQRIAALPAQLAKLLTHSPQQAVLLLFMWLVFGMPIYLWSRRRQLLSATEGT